MADDNNKVIFGAEFEGEGVKRGIQDVLDSLDKAREAELLFKQAISETNDALKENRKELGEAQKALKGTFDPKLIEEQTKKVQALNTEYDNLVKQQVQLGVGQAKIKDVVKEHTKAITEQGKAHGEVSKAVSKFTSLNHIAADGVKKIGNYAKDAAFSFVAGFAGGIVGAVVPALIEWVSGMIEASDELTKLQKNQKIVNDVLTQASKSVGDDVAKLEVYKNKLNDTNIPAAERVKIAKEYNKTADETNKIDLKQIDNLQLINEKIEAQNKLILQRAISTAALAKLTEASTAFVDAQLKLDEELKRTGLTEAQIQKRQAENVSQQIDVRNRQITSLDGYTRKQVNSSNEVNKALNKEEAAVARLLDTRNDARKQLDELAALLNPLITPDGLTTPGGKTPVIENVFQQKLAELRSRLATAMSASFQSEPLIRRQFARQLDREFLDIGNLLKDKKLTGPQADILKGLLQQINDIDLAKGLEDFRAKVAEALKKVNDTIFASQLELAQKSVANIRDEFERDAATIEQNFQGVVSTINQRQQAFLADVDKQTKAGLLSPELAKRKKFIAELVFGDLINQSEVARLNAQADLVFKTAQRNIENAKAPFENELLGLSEEATQSIREQTAKFFEGEISYDRYQKRLTDIIKKESRQRRDIAIEEADTQLKLVQAALSNTNLTAAQRKSLEDQERALRNTISNLKREALQGGAKDQQDADKARIDKILSFVNAVQSLAQAVVGFWQQVNQAEAAALDRSIALQNKRVSNAQELAEKGNAEFLEMEQKRLDELERRREANARKQLAINNALAASQAIVAAITAIAQAVQTGSPFAAIAAVAAVIGAIGAVYQFANSLNSQNPSFFEGTELVTGPAPAGRDKVRANLHVGERVVRANDNTQYWDTLSAIHNHLIPPNVLNDFVNHYPNGGLPLVDFDRLGLATDGFIGGDSIEVLNKLDKVNNTMEGVIEAVAAIGIRVNMDGDGFEAVISKASKTRKLRSRA
jgi:hypothetical protein